MILDTHVWIWFAEGVEGVIPEQAVEMLNAAANHGALWVSVISVWELGLLEAKGRLRLSVPARDWVQRALDVPGMRLADFGVEIALACHALPGGLHADPADRILVATARHLGVRLATRDRQILAYGKAGFVQVLAV